MNKLTVLKIIAPMAIAAFILGANIVYKISAKEGTVSLLPDEKYYETFVKDVSFAKKSIKCAMYMFKLDEYLKNDLSQPVPLISEALVSAAKKGVDTVIIFELGEKDEITTKYNQKTAKYFEDNGVKIAFDDPERRLHTKMCVIDERIVYIGSHNYTNSAMRRNSEVSVRIISEGLAKDAIKYLSDLGI